MKKEEGITLIVLVVTIIVLIILAGVSINMIFSENGLVTKAKQAAENMEIAKQEEDIALDNLLLQVDNTSTYNDIKKVNEPILLTGMDAIKFTEPTKTTEGITVKTSYTDENWYDYSIGNWANSQTQDGSMWVWIPRYAYKIIYYTDENKTIVSNTKTSYGSIDVKFLIGITDTYYKEDGTIGIAQRQTDINQIIDTTVDYTVHPAFTNEKTINYSNGGWRKELTGIWVSKFEAGYASGNNSAPVKASSVKYTEPRSWVYKDEAVTENNSRQVARNWLDGIYAKKDTNGTITYDNGATKYNWVNGEVSIKYPTFQPLTYSMNYINHNDSYNIARALTENGNIYELSNNNADSHLMKNSEIGAVSYLSQSKYGLKEDIIYRNNINLNNSTSSIYAVTGMSGNSESASTITTTIDDINNRNLIDAYVWSQKEGTKASSTGTIYGIYDLSGGLWERTACLVYNGHLNLNHFGSSLLNNGISTEYATIYPNNELGITDANTAGQNNYESNTKIYGDVIKETSIKGIGLTSWNKNYSIFSGYNSPFFTRGGSWYDTKGAGINAFARSDGTNAFDVGLRVVLVAQ